MAEATVTWKLSPHEARTIRAALEQQAEDTHERSREVRGENPKLSRDLAAELVQLRSILERI